MTEHDSESAEEHGTTDQIELHPDEQRASSVFAGMAAGFGAAAIASLYATEVVGEPLKWWMFAGTAALALSITYLRYRQEVNN